MKIAVYVPCFNGAAWIEECVEALLAQTRPATEVAVVDDGSTDDSAAIVRRFGSRVRLIQHERNRGLAVARNTALREIECDVLASVDADVRASPEWLFELAAAFDSPAVGAAGGKLIEAHQERPADRWRAGHMAQHAGEFPLRDSPTLAGATMAVRREVARAMGGYDETLRTNYEDADLRVRLVERGYRCAYAPDAVAFHLRRDTPQSVLRTYWGWLRPPAERAGAFDSGEGLERRRRDVWERTIRAIWADAEQGAWDLAYLSLLMGLSFPVADAVYAADRADDVQGIGGAWQAGLSDALAAWAPALAQAVVEDVRAVGWWDGTRLTGSGQARLSFGPREALHWVPAAWWRQLARGRERMAALEGWRQVSSAPVSGGGSRPPNTLAILEHGARRERLRVTHESEKGGIAAHRIGWLPASPLQQSLLRGGRLVAGEAAVLDVIPHWRAERIEPQSALDELRAAGEALDAGEYEGARERVLNALLIARRGYALHEPERGGTLRRLWPAMEGALTLPVEVLIARARELVEEWLLTWQTAPSPAARSRWDALRRAARTGASAS